MQNKKVVNTRVRRGFTVYRKHGYCFIKIPLVNNPIVKCNYCCQVGHVYKFVMLRQMCISFWVIQRRVLDVLYFVEECRLTVSEMDKDLGMCISCG